jgi:NTE family protein
MPTSNPKQSRERAQPATKRVARKPRIAIACQGGGAQTAFTAGVFRGLFEDGALDDFELVSLSGTSGGSICATLVWYSLMLGDERPWERLYEFWRENAASSPAEKLFNRMVVESMRLTSAGRIPSVSLSPTSPVAKLMLASSTKNLRPLFINFRGLLEKYIDFGRLLDMGSRPNETALLVGAVDVLSGRLAKFCSTRESIRVEHILASCAVPSIFAAVELDGSAYWDGLFSDNPPISELIQPSFVGERHLPDEIWVIKINSTRSSKIPQTPHEITDRRNELVGNVSLFQQLDAIRIMNEMFLQGAFTADFTKKLNIDAPIAIPKSFADDPERDYHIPFIEMSETLADSLDYESKIDRSIEHIERLMQDGEQQARRFMAQRRAMAVNPESSIR